MAYRSPSKYTPGGGVLAFFEQVSRFVSLSVLGWIILSAFLILFVADGKITDSFELRLLKGIFTEGRLFGTALVLLALNGLIGGIIAIPSAVVLFMCRQYLDYQAGRGIRRGNAFKYKFVRSLPATILVLSHALALLANLIAAPQLTRHWFKQESHMSSFWVASHFALTSLTRTSFDRGQEHLIVERPDKVERSVNTKQERQLYLVFAPAEFIESEDFKSEQSKLKDSRRIPYIMSRSNIIDQLDSLMTGSSSPVKALFKKSLNSPSVYGKLQKKGSSKVLLALSPQLRFGRRPTGFGAESLTGLKDDLLIYEAQRRILLSQFQIFGVLKIFDGVPFWGRNLQWLQLISDDVLRIRNSAQILSRESKDSSLVSVIQLSSIENRFSNIHSPFSPIGWPAKISSTERRLITKNMIRELGQFFNDVGASESSLWAIIPYADEKRTNPMSQAIIKSSGELSEKLRSDGQRKIGLLDEELGRLFSSPAAGEDSGSLPETPRLSKLDTAKAAARLKCFETEVDSMSSDFQFQPVEVRERSLGEFLNSLLQLPDQDFYYRSESSLNLIARETGFGFLCKTDNPANDEIFLLKHRVNNKNSKPNSSSMFFSVLFGKNQNQVESTGRISNTKVALGSSMKPAGLQDDPDIYLRDDVFDEFQLYQMLPAGTSESQSNYSWRRIDDHEARLFFSKFEIETLRAIETFARARIR